MALTKDAIAAEIEERRQLAEKQRSQGRLELDEVNRQIENAKYELSVTKDKLNAVTEALFDKNAELKARKDAFESANRAIYNDLASSEAQVAAMLGQIESLKAKKSELETEVGMLISDMSDRLRIYGANISDTVSKMQKSVSRTVTVQDKLGLSTLLQLNPNILAIVEDAEGSIHLIDNRAPRVAIVNDSLSTEREGAVLPFRYIKPLKPIKSNRGNVITTLDSLSDAIGSYTRWAEQIPQGVFVEPSYGGVRLQIHKVGPRVTIWDENRVDWSDRLPTVIESVGLVPHSFVVDGFLEVEATPKPLKKSEILGMLQNNDTLLEQKSRFIVTDIMWMDNKDCHADSLESRNAKLTMFAGKYKNLVAGKRTKVYNKQDCMESISQMCRTPNATGAIMKHPDYTYGLGGTTTMAIEFAAKKTLNVKIIYSSPANAERSEYIYDCAVLDDNGTEIYVGKTDVTTFAPDIQALKVEFRTIHEFIDPSTDIPHFNMIGARAIDAVELDEVSSAWEAKAFADMDETPVRPRAQPELGILFSSPDVTPFDDIELDCACRAKKQETTEIPQIDAEFKLKEQIYTIVNDNKSHSKPIYHLLVQLPTKILDFVSTMNPINQHPCNMERSTATKMHWEVAGELSPRHKLNDGKNQKSIISTIDQGLLKVTTDGDLNYNMKMYIKGDYIDGNFELSRLSKHSDSWTFNTAGVV